MSIVAHRRRRNVLNLFGFPTTINSGFLMFLVLLGFVYPFPLGLWIAGSVAVFTVIHELGHALAARASGYKASISLDFMIAYASYETNGTTRWRHKALIAVAGPLLQVGVAVVILSAMGVNPLHRDDITRSDFTVSIWWAGLVLGLINLIPLMPLDGGALVASIAEHLSPTRGRAMVLKGSFIVTAALVAFCLTIGAFAEIVLLAFMLVLQYQQIVSPQRLKKLLATATLEPGGDPGMDRIIIEALMENQEWERALDFALGSYRMCPAFSHAMSVARIHVKLGNLDGAAHWLSVANRSQLRHGELQEALSTTDEFDLVRTWPGVSAEWFAQV